MWRAWSICLKPITKYPINQFRRRSNKLFSCCQSWSCNGQSTSLCDITKKIHHFQFLPFNTIWQRLLIRYVKLVHILYPWTRCTNQTMHQCHIPQCTIMKYKCVHNSVTKWCIVGYLCDGSNKGLSFDRQSWFTSQNPPSPISPPPTIWKLYK